MGLAEADTAEADCIADRAVIAGQFGAGLQVPGRHIIAKCNAERLRIGRIRMVEMAPIVPAKHPQLQLAVKSRVSFQKTLQLFRHVLQLVVGEDPVDAAVEPPDELSCPDRLAEEHADPMDRTGPELSFDHHHLRLHSQGSPRNERFCERVREKMRRATPTAVLLKVAYLVILAARDSVLDPI
jgi:hypothetical protein